MSEDHLPVLASQSPMLPRHLANPGPTLKQLWTIAWAYRVPLITVVLITTFLGGLISKLMPKTYEATATLLVSYEINDPLGGEEFPLGMLGSYFATQIGLIQSSSVLLPVIDNLKLLDDERYVEERKPNEDVDALRRLVMEGLLRDLTVRQGAWGSQFIYVTFASHEPAEAARIANAITREYLAQKLDWANGPVSDRADRYSAKLEELRLAVESAQTRVTEFREASGLLDLSSDLELDNARLSTLEQRLLEAQENRRDAETRLNRNSRLDDSVLESAVVQDLKGQLATYNTRMAQLRTTVGARHPEVLALQSEINSTRRALDAEVSVYAESADAQLRKAREMERQIEVAVAEQRAKVLQQRKLQEEGTRHLRELETAQAVYTQALNGYDKVVLGAGSQYTNMRVVSEAPVPLRSSKPDTIVNTIVAFIFGGGLAVAGCGAHEFLFRRVRCRDDLERDFGVPVLIELMPVSRRKELTV